MCQEIRKPPYFCMLRAHLGITASGLLLGDEEGFVPGIADRNTHVCLKVGEQELAAANTSNACSQGGIIFKSPSPEKPDSLIFILLVTTEEN